MKRALFCLTVIILGMIYLGCAVPTNSKNMNADLITLVVIGEEITPTFDPIVTSYAVFVPFITTSVTVSATTKDKNAKLVIEPAQPSHPKVGNNTVTITVTTQNWMVKKYSVVVKRAAYSDWTVGFSQLGSESD